MPYRDWYIGQCRLCGRPREEGERFSARGKCPSCGDGEMLRNVAELRAHRGPRFLRWRRGVAAGVGVVLPEELEPGELDSAAS